MATQRRVFDPATAEISFWQHGQVQEALAQRDVGALFKLYLSAFPQCTQTRLATLTEHDRSDISNFVRGTRSGCVSDIQVLTRIADGLRMPDHARVLVGIAPTSTSTALIIESGGAISEGRSLPHTDALTGWLADPEPKLTCSVAICGSRAPETNGDVITETVRCLARLLVRHRYQVIHGPIGIGVEVLTYIADRFRPDGLTVTTGRFGHANVIRDAEYVLVIGGGVGTQDEADLAFSIGKKVIPLAASGGAARRAHDRMISDAGLRTWIPDQDFRKLEVATPDMFALMVRHLTNGSGGTE